MDDVTFVKSSYSGSQGCVAVGHLNNAVAIRDTKLSAAAREEQTQVHRKDKFAAFVQALKDDKLDPLT